LPTARTASAVTRAMKWATGGLTDRDSRSAGRTRKTAIRQASVNATPGTAGTPTQCEMVVPTRLNTTMTRVPPRPVSRGAPVGAGRVPAGACVVRPVLLPGSGFFFVLMPFLLYPLAGAKYGAFPGSGLFIFR